MSLTIRPGKPDRSRIDLTDEVALRHWMKTLNASKEDLAAAIAKVGNTVRAVRKELAGEQVARQSSAEA
jgi:predicted RNA-binding protein YlqC (UPF0109 family)